MHALLLVCASFLKKKSHSIFFPSTEVSTDFHHIGIFQARMQMTCGLWFSAVRISARLKRPVTPEAFFYNFLANVPPFCFSTTGPDRAPETNNLCDILMLTSYQRLRVPAYSAAKHSHTWEHRNCQSGSTWVQKTMLGIFFFSFAILYYHNNHGLSNFFCRMKSICVEDQTLLCSCQQLGRCILLHIYVTADAGNGSCVFADIRLYDLVNTCTWQKFTEWDVPWRCCNGSRVSNVKLGFSLYTLSLVAPRGVKYEAASAVAYCSL